MADGSGIKQITEEMEQAGREVAKDVKDSIGEMIEQAVQTTITPQQTLQQMNNPTTSEQQKQIEDQKKIAKVRGDLKWYKDIEEAQRRVREEQKQKEMQRLQEEEGKKEQKQIKVFEQKQKKQVVLGPTPMSNIENKNKMAA